MAVFILKDRSSSGQITVRANSLRCARRVASVYGHNIQLWSDYTKSTCQILYGSGYPETGEDEVLDEQK